MSMSVTRALVIVDIQNDYFPGGRCELVGPEAAAANAGRLLANQRAGGLPVFHIQHVRAMTPSTSLPERRASRSTTRCGRSRECWWGRRRIPPAFATPTLSSGYGARGPGSFPW